MLQTVPSFIKRHTAVLAVGRVRKQESGQQEHEADYTQELLMNVAPFPRRNGKMYSNNVGRKNGRKKSENATDNGRRKRKQDEKQERKEFLRVLHYS
jgi:hypothetical protein